MRASGLTATLLVLAAAVVGCGGSDDPLDEQKVSWGEQAQSICRDAAKEVAKLPDNLGVDPDDPGRAKEREILDEKLQRLSDVDVPANVAADYKRMLRLSTQSASAHTRFLEAAGDAADPQARADSVRLLQTQKRLGEQSSRIARDLHLANCGGA